MAALVVLLWNHDESGNASPRREYILTEKRNPVSPDALAVSAGERSVSPEAAAGAKPPQPAESSTAVPAPDYSSEAFTHVPAWIPRPTGALSASAEDASLRSDGYVEGTVSLAFPGADHLAALQEITAHLEAAGMAAGSGGTVYVSGNPPRQCEVSVAFVPGVGMAVKLSYQGTDHEKACLCPTCSDSMAPQS
jgi:hypothetical protein